MKDFPLFNITVPVFNRPELTKQTLEAVRKNTLVPYSLTVVDNGSDRETQKILVEMKKTKQIEYLFRLDKNYGVALAANIGWRLSDAPLYMKLDNDIVITSPQWSSLLLKQMQRHGKDAVWGGDFYNQLDNKNTVRKREGFIGKSHQHISGGAIIIPKGISDLIGYWSEDYGLYGCEDGDYGERLKEFSIDQFYFDHKPFMKHLGHDADVMEKQYNLKKKNIQDVYRFLWQTNKYLYENGHRTPNIPPQYVPTEFDGYMLKIGENVKYTEMRNALLNFHRIATMHEEFTKPFIDGLNNFISVQNRTWKDATEYANRKYDKIKAMLQ